MRSSLVVAAYGIALCATAVHAQSFPSSSSATSSPIRVGFAGGVIVPRTGASLATLKTGVHGQGFVLLQVPGLPALRLNGDYAHMKFDRSALLSGVQTSLSPTGAVSGASTGSAADADRTMIDGVASMQINLLKGPVRPYVLAGVGAFNVKDVVASAAASGTKPSFSSTNFGFDGGAGLSIKLGRLDMFAETRLQNVYTKQKGLIDTKSIRAFPVSFGFTF